MFLTEDQSPQTVSEMFTKHGDITVVKIGKATYWVEWESLDTHK